MALESFGNCLGWCLEHKRHVTALTKSLYFKGYPAHLDSMPCHLYAMEGGHSFYATNLPYIFKDQLLGLVPELGHHLPGCPDVSVSCEPAYGRQK